MPRFSMHNLFQDRHNTPFESSNVEPVSSTNSFVSGPSMSSSAASASNYAMDLPYTPPSPAQYGSASRPFQSGNYYPSSGPSPYSAPRYAPGPNAYHPNYYPNYPNHQPPAYRPVGAYPFHPGYPGGQPYGAAGYPQYQGSGLARALEDR